MTNRRRKLDDRVRLLHGPYQAPRLHVGDRASCLFRDRDVVVTSWTDALISWPRALPGGEKGHPGLLVDEELARAISTESAAAVRFWWGVSAGVVHRWRKALGVGRMDSEGSRRLILAASEKGADAVRGVPLPPEQVQQRRRTAIALNLGRNLRLGYHGRRWTDEEIALLDTLPDAEVATRAGRTTDAVRRKRESLGIPNPTARPGAYGNPPWTEEEDELVRRLPPHEAALCTGRTLHAVYSRRRALKTPAVRRGRRPKG
jgi:hypothetical protein